jgi:hypothetical protein
VEFEWDETKRQSNIAKHGIDFASAKDIWEGPVLTAEAEYRGESRFKAIGETHGFVIVVVFARRGKRRRLISARVANRKEREGYYRALERPRGRSQRLGPGAEDDG